MRERLTRARVARLATVTPGGQPHLVPICFVLDGDRVYTAIDQKPKRGPRLRRLANMEANPKVAILADHFEEDWSQLWWVRVDGLAHVLDNGPQARHALGLLEGKYAQYRKAPPPGPVIRVEIERWLGWSSSEGCE
jgi:PPOX class probable F420-dependent enzyme